MLSFSLLIRIKKYRYRYVLVIGRSLTASFITGTILLHLLWRALTQSATPI